MRLWQNIRDLCEIENNLPKVNVFSGFLRFINAF